MIKRKVHYPDPKTVGELRRSIAGYSDELELFSPAGIFIVERKGKPYKMYFKHKRHPK